MKKIVVDTLGSDQGEEEIVKGVMEAHRLYPEYRLVMVGNKENILKTLSDKGGFEDDYEILNSDPLDPAIHDVMAMLRFKGHCSLTDAFDKASSDPDVIGVLSAGPTGMLLVSAIKHIGLIDGVNFPALAALLINIKQKPVCLLDCGANIDVPAQKLVTFAQLGTALMKSFCGLENPRVGLMNVGKEDTKGDKLRKEAFALLKDSSLNFVGNLEGSDVFLDKADVITCDGFTGNVILKDSEATALICKKIVDMTAPGDEAALQASKGIYKMFAYNELGGAIVLGTKKIVMKAHGAANAKSIGSVIGDIIQLATHDAISNMEAALKESAEK